MGVPEVSVIVATFGAQYWRDQAENASWSARRQSVPVEVVSVHASSLHEARNEGARLADSEYLVFLDADDQLDEHYVEEMLKGTADLRQPATLGVYPDGSKDPVPVVIPPKPIHRGNWMVIGTMVRAELFYDAGGFWNEPAFEDWSLWWRCLDLGATWEAIPSAIYRIGVNDDGRNALTDPKDVGAAFRIVQQRHEAWERQRRTSQVITKWENV